MTLLDFDKLVKALMKLGKKNSPCYSVIKDLFDAIDKNHD
jgi:ribosomal protein S7